MLCRGSRYQKACSGRRGMIYVANMIDETEDLPSKTVSAYRVEC